MYEEHLNGNSQKAVQEFQITPLMKLHNDMKHYFIPTEVSATQNLL